MTDATAAHHAADVARLRFLDGPVADGVSEPLPPSRWKLTDLIDVDTIQSIQDTFASAFGLPTTTVNADGSSATSITHRQRFCEDLTRGTPLGGVRCLACDRSAMARAGRDHRPAIFECWNGLYDAAIPIEVKGEAVGYFLVGQVLHGPADVDRRRAVAAEIGVDADEYVDALQEVRRVPLDRYEAAVRSMHVLGQLIADQAAAAIDNLSVLQEAREARDDASRLVEEIERIIEGVRDVGAPRDYRGTLDAIADNLERLVPYDSCVILVAEGDELVPMVVRDPYPEAMRRHRPRIGEGVVGRVGATGVPRRIDDVTREPGFEPVPGVPLEPESVLAVPMVYDRRISGVIVLSRFKRRTFSEHELRVLTVFSGQASVAAELSVLAAENARRRRDEELFGRLRGSVSASSSVAGALEQIALVGRELLGADAAVARLEADGAGVPRVACAEFGDAAAEALLRALAPDLAAVLEDRQPRVVAHEGGEVLVVGLAVEDPIGVLLLVRGEPATEWDAAATGSLVQRASIGLGLALLKDRERRASRRTRQMAELARALVSAAGEVDARAELLLGTPEVVTAECCAVVSFADRPEVADVEYRDGRETVRFQVTLRGRARVAALRMRTEGSRERALFDVWADAVVAELARRAGTVVHLAEPLTSGEGVHGALCVGWRRPDVSPTAEQGRALALLADTASPAIARHTGTGGADTVLRARVRDLQALVRFAERTHGAVTAAAIVEELLAALREAGALTSAFLVDDAGGVVLEPGSALAADAAAALATGLVPDLPPEGVHLRPGDGEDVLAIPLRLAAGGDAVVIAVGGGVSDHQRETVLLGLVHHAALALESAAGHEHDRAALTRLEQANAELERRHAELERILAAHTTLTEAVLGGRGLQSAVRSLSESVDGEIVIVTPRDRVLAAWPPDCTIDWRPDADSDTRTVAVDGEQHLTSAPALVEGVVLAWLIARTPQATGETERAALEYGAVLAALELMRERTAMEVEIRLRGDVLDELISGEFVEDLIVGRGRALGFDFTRPARVYIVEPSAPGDRPLQPEGALTSPHPLYRTVFECAGQWGENLVAPRGAGVLVVVYEDDRAPMPFEDVLQRTCRERLKGTRLTIGAGTACTRPVDYRQSFMAARRGVDLMHLLGRADDVFSFRRRRVEHMLLETSDPRALVSFVATYVRPLDEWDRRHSSQLRKTLEAVFATGFNLEQAARTLHLHVSTLRYRLKKIGELLGVDLKDADVRLDVQVALKAARTLDVHRG